jgi:competence protein ComEC
VIGDADREYLDAVRIGDEVEVVGLLARPATPGNPGEQDFAAFLNDRGIRAEVRVAKGADGVTRLGIAGWSWDTALAALRARMTRLLDDALPHREAGLARALLLGDNTAMDREEWDAFARTGVIHVLAISGQHLVILAGFVWVILRAFDVRRRRGAWLVMALVVGYAALTGLKPSAVRATVMVCGVCGGILLRRPVLAANIFALGWLVVVAFDPADPFTVGCQLSFVAVFVLVWGAGRWFAPRPPDALEKLIDESRPAWVRAIRSAGRAVVVAYTVTLILTAATAPLVMLRQNVVPPVGVPIGPPLVFLTSAALLVGFIALLVGLVSPVLAGPFATMTGWLLGVCDRLVSVADRVPGGSLYVANPPVWWVVGFYPVLAAVVLLDGVWRRRAVLALAVWSVAGLVGIPADRGDELRVTFLSVGHGGCTVLECPDGRVLVYDAGSMSGPDVVRRVVAPYLWYRGIRRVDELFLSHADLDHFNGIPELARRFPIGRVTLTPSFADKPAAAVAEVLHTLDQRGVPREVAFAGHRFAAGGVEIEVLHPPRGGPPGSENERSLVLRVSHAGHTILLTGDLEKEGTAHVLALPSRPADVLMAPHHGSRAAFPASLRTWASPRLVVVCRGAQERTGVSSADAPGADVWDTGSYGAVTVLSNPTGLTAEAFRSGERIIVRRGGASTGTGPRR